MPLATSSAEILVAISTVTHTLVIYTEHFSLSQLLEGTHINVNYVNITTLLMTELFYRKGH